MKGRTTVLLRAARDLLIKQSEAGALNNYPLTVHYDDADCDGYCLLYDISAHLDDLREEHNVDRHDDTSRNN